MGTHNIHCWHQLIFTSECTAILHRTGQRTEWFSVYSNTGHNREENKVVQCIQKYWTEQDIENCGTVYTAILDRTGKKTVPFFYRTGQKTIQWYYVENSAVYWNLHNSLLWTRHSKCHEKHSKGICEIFGARVNI